MSDERKKQKKRSSKNATSNPDSWADLSGSILGADSDEEEKKSEKRTEEPSEGKPPKMVPSVPPTSPAKSRIRGIRVFIVDDDLQKANILAADLRSLGAEVSAGERNNNGYKKAARFLPDAIVSDLVRPGETGFQFIQGLRRHPLLRWSSVMLIHWWEETASGEGQVLLDQVLDQLEELLAPIRIIEERIAAKRPLGDRIEMNGPAGLLRILSKAGLSGELSTNDSWNIFTIELVAGRVLSVHRKGIDGEADGHLQAMLQFLLCDTGRWSFRAQKKYSKKSLVELETTLNHANGILSQLFGLGVERDSTLERHISVRQNFVRTASETMPDAALQVVRSISSGADMEHFRATLTTKKDIAEVERIIQTLFRCGAIRYSVAPGVNPSEPDSMKTSRSALHLLWALADMALSTSAPRESSYRVRKESSRKGSNKRLPRGAYHFQDVASERISVPNPQQRPIKLRADDSLSISDVIDLNDDSVSGVEPIGDEPREEGASSSFATISTATPMSERSEATDSNEYVFDRRTGQRIPRPTDLAQRDYKQMWLAIGLALLLGGLLAVGIAMIASTEKGGASADKVQGLAE